MSFSSSFRSGTRPALTLVHDAPRREPRNGDLYGATLRVGWPCERRAIAEAIGIPERLCAIRTATIETAAGNGRGGWRVWPALGVGAFYAARPGRGMPFLRVRTTPAVLEGSFALQRLERAGMRPLTVSLMDGAGLWGREQTLERARQSLAQLIRPSAIEIVLQGPGGDISRVELYRSGTVWAPSQLLAGRVLETVFELPR